MTCIPVPIPNTTYSNHTKLRISTSMVARRLFEYIKNPQKKTIIAEKVYFAQLNLLHLSSCLVHFKKLEYYICKFQYRLGFLFTRSKKESWRLIHNFPPLFYSLTIQTVKMFQISREKKFFPETACLKLDLNAVFQTNSFIHIELIDNQKT